MYKKNGLLFFYAESPVHWGAGASVGAIDLPIQRERHTGHPIGQASGIKGSLRDFIRRTKSDSATALADMFGPDTKGASEFAGCATFGDARIVLFPVRSLRGGFAWVTCPLALSRLHRDAGDADWKVPSSPAEGGALLAPNNILAKGSLVLEESLYKIEKQESLASIAKWLCDNAGGDAYFRDNLPARFVVLSDSDFQQVVRSSTVVETHTRIDDDTGTVKGGALFQSEYLPPETLLYSFVAIAEPFREGGNGSAEAHWNTLSGWLKDARIQTGGDASTGRGLVSLRIWENNGKSAEVAR